MKTKEQQALEELSDLMQLQVLLQTVVHKIDVMSTKPYFKQAFKMLTNKYYNIVEKKIEVMTKGMDNVQGDTYNGMVKEVEDLVGTIKVVTEY